MYDMSIGRGASTNHKSKQNLIVLVDGDHHGGGYITPIAC